MTDYEKDLRKTCGYAMLKAAENGATLACVLLKRAAETPAAQPQTPAPAAPTAPATPMAPAAAPANPATAARTPATNLADRWSDWSNQLTAWGNKNIGQGYGNYLSTGAGAAGLGALYGLLFGDRKHGTLDAILNNALLFGGLGLGGQYAYNAATKPANA